MATKTVAAWSAEFTSVMRKGDWQIAITKNCFARSISNSENGPPKFNSHQFCSDSLFPKACLDSVWASEFFKSTSCVLGRITILMYLLHFVCVKMHDFCFNAISAGNTYFKRADLVTSR